MFAVELVSVPELVSMLVSESVSESEPESEAGGELIALAAYVVARNGFRILACVAPCWDCICICASSVMAGQGLKSA